jgi:hypothetical protein
VEALEDADHFHPLLSQMILAEFQHSGEPMMEKLEEIVLDRQLVHQLVLISPEDMW